jgi:sec-independent protein translocase protein TatA
MFGGFGMTELIVILVIVIMLFGTKKLRNMGGDLGTAIKGFRKAMSSDESTEDADPKTIADERHETLSASEQETANAEQNQKQG